jgi:2-dehydropantoate 2-reductase
MTDQTKPSVVIVGAGAMGSLFGGRLAEGGLPVTLVDVARDHIEAINRNRGLRIVGFGGERLIPIKATTDASSVREAGIVFFQCKALSNEDAATSVRHLFGGGKKTVAVSFQNGLGNEGVIGRIVGKENVLAGLAVGGASLEAPGVVRSYTDLPHGLGEIAGGLSERALFWARVLNEHKLRIEAKPQIMKDKWKKLFANIAFSATSGATNLTLGEVAGHPELRETALRAIDEAAAVAAAEGLPMSQEETTETFHELVAPHGSHRNKSSMRRDIDNRRPSEVAYIYGTVVALGDKHGIPTPTLKTLVAIIKGIEQHYVKPREASGAAA